MSPDSKRGVFDVSESRRRQGLPPKIEDPAAIARIAAIIGPWKEVKPTRSGRGGDDPLNLSQDVKRPGH